MTQVRISAKNLGGLALDSFCPRCFWVQVNCDVPFQMPFPGIFSSIDSYSKRITSVHHQKFAAVPKWLTTLGKAAKPLSVPHYSKYFVVDSGSDIKLWGAPDEIFQFADGSHFIIDYKTAKYTATQDELLPMYEVQLNAYAYIGNRCGFRPVKGLGLVYYEPQTALTAEGIGQVLLDSGFYMPFASHLMLIPLRPEKFILLLLRKLRTICDERRPPKGAAGCEDCERLDGLLRLLVDQKRRTRLSR